MRLTLTTTAAVAVVGLTLATTAAAQETTGGATGNWDEAEPTEGYDNYQADITCQTCDVAVGHWFKRALSLSNRCAAVSGKDELYVDESVAELPAIARTFNAELDCALDDLGDSRASHTGVADLTKSVCTSFLDVFPFVQEFTPNAKPGDEDNEDDGDDANPPDAMEPQFIDMVKSACSGSLLEKPKQRREIGKDIYERARRFRVDGAFVPVQDDEQRATRERLDLEAPYGKGKKSRVQRFDDDMLRRSIYKVVVEMQQRACQASCGDIDRPDVENRFRGWSATLRRLK